MEKLTCDVVDTDTGIRQKNPAEFSAEFSKSRIYIYISIEKERLFISEELRGDESAPIMQKDRKTLKTENDRCTGNKVDKCATLSISE